MYQPNRHIIILLLCLLTNYVSAQQAMPDTVCIGTSRTYQVNTPATPSTYTWRVDGVLQAETRNSIALRWTNPGVYTISVQEHAINGCDGDVRTGTVVVNASPIPNAGPDLVACAGTPMRLSASGGAHYNWSPAIRLSDPSVANPQFLAAKPGIYTYSVSVTDANGCPSVVVDSVTVTVKSPPRIYAGRDTNIATGQSLQLTAADLSNTNIVSYTWTPSGLLNDPFIKDPVARITGETVFYVTARNSDGCQATDDIKVTVFKEADIYVPTAFTPNGDGLNEFARVIAVGIKQFKYFTIYDRWGAVVFTTSDPSKGWDGKRNGVEQSTTTYVWMAQGIDFRGNLINKKGSLTLIR